MNSYSVTIKDITAWTIEVRANGSIEAQAIAWNLFQSASDRSEHFEEDGDTTVKVEEITQTESTPS